VPVCPEVVILAICGRADKYPNVELCVVCSWKGCEKTESVGVPALRCSAYVAPFAASIIIDNAAVNSGNHKEWLSQK
jgi:hypothetical protein